MFADFFRGTYLGRKRDGYLLTRGGWDQLVRGGGGIAEKDVQSLCDSGQAEQIISVGWDLDFENLRDKTAVSECQLEGARVLTGRSAASPFFAAASQSSVVCW